MNTLPSDPQLPYLPTMFQPERVLARLGTAIPAGAVCDIERVKYRPQRNCVVAYRLRGQNAPDRRVAVCMYRAADIVERFSKARAIAPEAQLLPDLDAIAWPFPSDRKLPSLPLLVARASCEALWLRPLIELHRPGGRLLAFDDEVVSFFPEHGATLRVHATLQFAAAGKRLWELYGQTRYDDDAARAYRVMESLRHAASAARVPAYSARPLLYDAARRVLWQEGIGAPTLASVLDHGLTVDWRAVTRAVLRCQASKIDLPVERDRETLLGQLQSASSLAMQALPEHAAEIARLQRLVRDTSPSSRELTTLVHGDLHSKNILSRAKRAWLIDFDRVARGDPLADIGSLAAELVYRDCVAARAVNLQRVRAVLEAYRDQAPWTVERSALAWNVAAALLRERVFRAVTSLKPGRIAAIPRLLAAAAQFVA